MNNHYTLAAIKIRAVNEWQTYVLSELRIPGWSISKNKNILLLMPDKPSGTYAGKSYSNSFELNSIWCGSNYSAIGVLSVRKWIDPKGHIDPRPEHVILEGANAPKLNLPNETVNIKKILDALCKLGGLEDEPIVATAIGDDLNALTQIYIKDHIAQPPVKLNQLHYERGFHSVPDGFTIKILPMREVDESFVCDFETYLKKYFAVRKARPAVARSSSKQVSPQKNQAVVLLLAGGKETPLSAGTVKGLARLDEHKVLWRRAYQNDPHKNSIPNQIGSILQCAGGIPF